MRCLCPHYQETDGGWCCLETLRQRDENAELKEALARANAEIKRLRAERTKAPLEGVFEEGTPSSQRLKETRAVVQALSEACSAYARMHPDYVFDQTFSVSPIGVESGDVEIDGRTYHFTHGFDGYVRAEPSEKLTQEFLKGLPEGWAKPSLSLDTTALNKAKLGEEDLAEFGLVRKVKETWFEV